MQLSYIVTNLHSAAVGTKIFIQVGLGPLRDPTRKGTAVCNSQPVLPCHPQRASLSFNSQPALPCRSNLLLSNREASAIIAFAMYDDDAFCLYQDRLHPGLRDDRLS